MCPQPSARISAAVVIAICFLPASAALADDVIASGGEFSLREQVATQPAPTVEGGLVEYLADRFSPHEPIYFLWGPDDPQIKFQVSLKYQIFTPGGGLDRALPWVSGFHVAYTQQSFWDIGEPSELPARVASRVIPRYSVDVHLHPEIPRVVELPSE